MSSFIAYLFEHIFMSQVVLGSEDIAMASEIPFLPSVSSVVGVDKQEFVAAPWGTFEDWKPTKLQKQVEQQPAKTGRVSEGFFYEE